MVRSCDLEGHLWRQLSPAAGTPTAAAANTVGGAGRPAQAEWESPREFGMGEKLSGTTQL